MKIDKTTKQFIRFGLVGISNAIISYFFNIMVLLALKKWEWSCDYVVANVIAFLLSVLWSFHWNYKFVFVIKAETPRDWLQMLFKTYLVYGMTGIVLTNILSWIWISCLSISRYIAPIINIIINMPLNFILNKKWTFKQQ